MSELNEEYITRGLSDITDELITISDTIKSSGDRKYYDESLGETIKTMLVSLIEQIDKSHSNKKYYDESLGDTIKQSLTDAVVAITKMGRPQVDMSPVIKIAEGIAEQNKSIIDGIHSMLKKENVGDKYEKLFSMVIKMIEKNNEFIEASMNQKEYIERMERLIAAVNKRPDEWIFKHNVEYGNITSTTAKPKYK